jgi:uncharacterized protein (TIGR02118 family)
LKPRDGTGQVFADLPGRVVALLLFSPIRDEYHGFTRRELAGRTSICRFGVAGSAKLTQNLRERRRSSGEHQMREQPMIKVSVMYPNTPGARFDHAYYRDKHMPLLKARMGDACKSYTVDKGIAGGAPGAPATYVGMCHIFCDSVEAFQAGFGPHAKEIMGDIPNYTDLSPVIQISEVVVG